jgi:hypothetical protein
LSKANLSKADLRGAQLLYTDLSSADLSEANLGGDLQRTDSYLSYTVLDWANLSNANLQKADLRVAQLGHAILRGADLSGANLTDAILIGADLAGAKYNSETQWPSNVDPERAGAIRIETPAPVPTSTPVSIPIPTATLAPTSTPAPTSSSCPDVFSNPERGFYHFTETHSNNYAPLDLNTLRYYRQCEGISLIHRSFYLDDFVTGPISQGYLDAMQRDFDIVREAGLKAIIRFAYSNGPDVEPPYGDASKNQILSHIQQLSPILQANSDVIATLQAGFIGVWGEWWYSDYFSVVDWDARREVLLALLDVLPSNRNSERPVISKISSILRYQLGHPKHTAVRTWLVRAITTTASFPVPAITAHILNLRLSTLISRRTLNMWLWGAKHVIPVLLTIRPPSV